MHCYNADKARNLYKWYFWKWELLFLASWEHNSQWWIFSPWKQWDTVATDVRISMHGRWIRTVEASTFRLPAARTVSGSGAVRGTSVAVGLAFGAVHGTNAPLWCPAGWRYLWCWGSIASPSKELFQTWWSCPWCWKLKSPSREIARIFSHVMTKQWHLSLS